MGEISWIKFCTVFFPPLCDCVLCVQYIRFFFFPYIVFSQDSCSGDQFTLVMILVFVCEAQ